MRKGTLVKGIINNDDYDGTHGLTDLLVWSQRNN